MGETFSKPSEPNPTSSPPPTATEKPAMSPPQSSAETPESETPVQESSDPPTDSNPAETHQDNFEEKSDKESAEGAGGEQEEEEEEEGECGFCLFMKGGGCKDAFVDWEKCVEEGEKNNEDIVDKCFEATSALKKCMEAHTDYYAPLLQAEKAAEAEAMNQLEDEKAAAKEKEKDGGEETAKEEAS